MTIPDRITIPEKFLEQEGFRKLSPGAIALYFFMLTLEEKYGGAFMYSCDRFVQDLNVARATFFKSRDELVARGFIAISSTAERERNGTFRQSVKYFVLEE